MYIYSRFFITEETWQYTVRVEDCKFINITEDDNTTSSNNTSNSTDSEPIPPCPMIFAVRSSGIADVDASSEIKDCSKVSEILNFLFSSSNYRKYKNAMPFNRSTHGNEIRNTYFALNIKKVNQMCCLDL